MLKTSESMSNISPKIMNVDGPTQVHTNSKKQIFKYCQVIQK
jgi:hypothetical protein